MTELHVLYNYDEILNLVVLTFGSVNFGNNVSGFANESSGFLSVSWGLHPKTSGLLTRMEPELKGSSEGNRNRLFTRRFDPAEGSCYLM